MEVLLVLVLELLWEMLIMMIEKIFLFQLIFLSVTTFISISKTAVLKKY